MTDLDGWQQLLPLSGTPLMHTGQADELSEAEIVTMPHKFFPEWQPTTG